MSVHRFHIILRIRQNEVNEVLVRIKQHCPHIPSSSFRKSSALTAAKTLTKNNNLIEKQGAERESKFARPQKTSEDVEEGMARPV